MVARRAALLALLCEGVVLHRLAQCVLSSATSCEAAATKETPDARVLTRLAEGVALLSAVAAPLREAAVVDPHMRTGLIRVVM